MKTLILVRHSHAESRSDGIGDFERPLSRRGMEDAVKVASSLQRKKIIPDRILASAAERAAVTATIIAEHLGISADNIEYSRLLYYSSPKTIMNFIYGMASEVKTVMIVAHNPGISDLVRSLSSGSTGFMENTMTAVFRYDIGNWFEIDENNPVAAEIIKASDPI